MNIINLLHLKGIKLITPRFRFQKATLINVNVNTNTVKPPEDSQNVVEPNFPSINTSTFGTNSMQPSNAYFQPKIIEEVSSENKIESSEYIESTSKLYAFKDSLPFDLMPGPQSIKMLAKLWNFFPLASRYEESIQKLVGADNIFGYLSWYNSLPLFKRMINEYGPLVRLHGPFGGNVVILLRLEDAMTLIKTEGSFPIRSCIDSLEQYRLQYRKYKQAGPFLTCGPEWKKMRNVVEGLLCDYVDNQFKVIDEASNEFINRILHIRNKQDEVLSSFYNEINKWSLECICSILLNKRFGFLESAGINFSSEPARILDSVKEVVTAIHRCEFGIHFWKIVETPGWKNLVKYCDVLDTIFNKYVHKAQDSLRHKKNSNDNLTVQNISFLESLLLKEEISSEDSLTLLLDMVIIGSTAVTHAVAFLLYHLARYTNAQRKLYEEIKKTSAKLTRQDLSNMPYLQACLKESLRLKQPIPILNRVLPENSLIHNYQVPKNTHVLIPTQLYSLKEEYFEDSLKFKPDRWLYDDLELSNFKLSALSFGCGSKSCFAQALAEMQLGTLVVQILRKFRVAYQYGEINSTNQMLAAPDRPLRFSFIDRD